MPPVRIRSDKLRAIVNAAIEQDVAWLDPKGNHPALVCTVCGHREIFTTTGRQHEHEIKKKACRLRRHGLRWEGRGGTHEL